MKFSPNNFFPKIKPKIFNRLISKGRNRTKQKNYREKLIKKFGECPISKLHYKLCEAAHIYPYYKCPSLDKYTEYNGILLGSHIHKAFDRNYFTIDENTCKIKILKENMEKDNVKDLKEIGLDGKDGFYIKNLDNSNAKKYLEMRNKEI